MTSEAKIILPEDVWESWVNRLCAAERVDRATAETDAKEALLFLGFCARNPGRRFTPSERVDRAWHILLQFTVAYRDLCQSLAGSPIDHTPPRSLDEARWLAHNFDTTVRMLRDQGTEFNPHLWEKAATSICGCGQ